MQIEYPYIPKGKKINYTSIDNVYMARAQEVARTQSLDKQMPGGAVIVKDGKIIGEGANGSDFHEYNICERVKQNSASGEDYEICEGCHPKNHSEATAIADAIAKNNNTDQSVLYLWGHWWCCQACWGAMEKAKIKSVYLLKGSEKLFNKDHPENIIGHQFG